MLQWMVALDALRKRAADRDGERENAFMNQMPEGAGRARARDAAHPATCSDRRRAVVRARA
jgi:hypothetical protein